MTDSSDEALQALRDDIERMMGRCVLRLQRCEQQIKAIAAHQELSGPIGDLEAIRAEREAGIARKTLGTLVRQLLGSYLVRSETGTPFEATANSPDEANWFSFRFHLALSDPDFDQTESELEEFVLLRNNLVHQFLDKHDLQSLDGCRSARDALVAADDRIDYHAKRLRESAIAMEQVRQHVNAYMQSDAFHDLVVNGIASDGTVDWRASGGVRALREAAGALAINGWTPVAEAVAWIAERHPEQFPAKYGCNSWRQVAHESRLFELRHLEIDGERSAWYREKRRPEN